MTTLVTGVPSLLARRLAQAQLARAPDARVVLFANEADAWAAAEFVAGLPADQQARARVVVGALPALHLGLSGAEYRELAAGLTGVLRAAETSWLSAPVEELQAINVQGTRAVLELAADCRQLRRFTHLSTVFVSGDREGVVMEDELAAGQGFRNEYERTRFEAEILVRGAMGTLPCTVVRPGIVVGDSKTGEIDRFEGPYAVAMLLVTSPLAVPVPLPGDGVAPLNVVPLDFVVAAATHLHGDPRAVGRTFHVVDPNPSSSRRVYELVAQRAGKKLPRVTLGYRFTDALLRLPGLERLTRDQRRALAYVNHLTFYSTRNALELLDGSGIRCPPIESYLDQLIGYVKETVRKEKAGS